MGGSPPIAALSSEIYWASYGHAGGADWGQRSPSWYAGSWAVLGESLAWSSTADDDGTRGIVFLFEGVTARTSPYMD